MKTKISPTAVGLFVIGALALAVFALLGFGGFNFFSHPQRFLVSFDESIHGLDLGSPVKLRGVHIGRVVDLNVRYDEASNRSVVQVLCEFSKAKINDPQGMLVDVSDRVQLQHLVDKGMRAQLGVLGLATGLLFVELDFFDPKEYPAPAAVPEAKYVAVPSVTSTIAEFQTNLTEILNDIKRVDFAGIGAEVKKLLTDANVQMARVDAGALASQWLRTGASIETLAGSPEIKSILTNLETSSGELNKLLARLNTQVDLNGTEIQATLKQLQETVKTFNEAAGTVQRFVQAQRGLGEDVAGTLRQVSDAAAALQQLAEFLQRNPNALLYGKKPAP